MAQSFTFGRRRRRVLATQTALPASAAAASPILPPRQIIVRVLPRRYLWPRQILATHGFSASAGPRGIINPRSVVAAVPQRRRPAPPKVYHSSYTVTVLPVLSRVQPRPVIVPDPRRGVRPVHVWSGRAFATIPATRPQIVAVRVPSQPKRIPPQSLRSNLAVPSQQPVRPSIIRPAPAALRPPRPVVFKTSGRVGRISLSRAITPGHQLIVRERPHLPWKWYVTSIFSEKFSRQITPTKPIVAGVWRGPGRTDPIRASWLTRAVIASAGAGSIVPKPLRPLIVQRPPPFKLPIKLITPAVKNPLNSPPLANPLPRKWIAIPGRLAPRLWPKPISSQSAYPTGGQNPVNPPLPGAPSAPPDLVAACIAWLRQQPAIVAAFNDSAATPKFGSDIEPRNTAPPYLVFHEPEEDEGYETQDFTGLPSSLATGTLWAELVGSQALGKVGTRQLAEIIVGSLNDAPLTFLDGVLVYLRRSQRQYPSFLEKGPGSNVATWKRVLEFDYKIERYVT